MEHPSTLPMDYDEEHNLEGGEYISSEGQVELEEELSVVATESSDPFTDGLKDVEGSPEGIFWYIMAALCFLSGLSIGIIFYLRSSFALTIADWLRRCCPRIFRGTTQDPVLLAVVDRKNKDEEKKKKSEGSSSSDEERKSDKKDDEITKVMFHMRDSDGDAVENSADKCEKEKGEEEGGEAEAAKGEDNKENTNEEKEKDACENGKTKGNSSSSSSSDNEDNDEKRSVRHRKKVRAEASQEGEQCDAEHKAEHKE